MFLVQLESLRLPDCNRKTMNKSDGVLKKAANTRVLAIMDISVKVESQNNSFQIRILAHISCRNYQFARVDCLPSLHSFPTL